MRRLAVVSEDTWPAISPPEQRNVCRPIRSLCSCVLCFYVGLLTVRLCSMSDIVFYWLADLPSVLWRCWLGGRKGIRPVKKWVVGCWHGCLVWSIVQTCIWPSWCHCHSLSLASVKSRLVLPFLYRLTRVVPDKGPLNVCVWLADSLIDCDWIYSAV